MRLDAAALPEWPITLPTREAAIAAALDVMEPGDIMWIHQDGCATRLDEACDCNVSLIPYPTVVQ